MTISNYNNKYVQVKSEFISDLIQNLQQYQSIEVKGNINCCPDYFTKSVQFTQTGWYIDLTKAVQAESILDSINIQNVLTLQKISIPANTIDAGYVNNNCTTNSCTLQDFSGYFIAIIKPLIDNWFAVNGLTSNVSVTIQGNILIVGNLPANFIMHSIEYGAEQLEFGYSGINTGFFLQDDSLFIKPQFFGIDKLIDGVYKFEIKISKTQSFTIETNCAFIDIETKCKVAATLQNIKKESETKGIEKCSTIIHLLHYALINGSNCGCNCDEMCKVYKELYRLLNNIDPQIVNDCGC